MMGYTYVYQLTLTLVGVDDYLEHHPRVGGDRNPGDRKYSVRGLTH